MQMQAVIDGEGIENKLLAIAGLITEPYDAVTVSYPTSTQEIYSFKTGGVSGTVILAITIDYTDSTKEFISQAFRV